jgi:dihydroorotase
MFDLVIHGRTYSGGLRVRWVYISGGVIRKVRAEPTDSAAAKIELPAGSLLLPAATDLHVHFRDWDQRLKETVETGSKSALAGGVTTVAEMPNTTPRLDSREVVEKRVDLLKKTSHVDFAIHGAVPPRAEDLRRLKQAGCFGIKFFSQDLPRFESLAPVASKMGLKLAVHAEVQEMIGTPDEAMAEEKAVDSILRWVPAKTEVRFAHVSTSAAAKAILLRKRTNPNLSMEVTPHHLFTDEQTAASRIGEGVTVRPPLRSAQNAARLRRLLRDGAFDFYATDHAPHTVEEKLIAHAPGFPALEFAFPLLLSRTRDVPLSCRVYCEAPAAYLGLKKGKVEPGYAADLVVMSRRSWVIEPDRFWSKARVTPFAGEKLDYRVDQVIIRGNSAYREGKFLVRRPCFVP